MWFKDTVFITCVPWWLYSIIRNFYYSNEKYNEQFVWVLNNKYGVNWNLSLFLFLYVNKILNCRCADDKLIFGFKIVMSKQRHKWRCHASWYSFQWNSWHGYLWYHTGNILRHLLQKLYKINQPCLDLVHLLNGHWTLTFQHRLTFDHSTENQVVRPHADQIKTVQP